MYLNMIQKQSCKNPLYAIDNVYHFVKILTIKTLGKINDHYQ